MIIKICGITQLENLKELSSLPVDWFGFIRYEPSKRYVKNEGILKEDTPQKKVVVFVDEEMENMKSFLKKYPVELVQLHGFESIETCRELRKNGYKVIKAFSVDKEFHFEKTRPYEAVCDFFLFDTKGRNPGGNGQRFDWSVLKKYNGSIPFLLSGGIGLEHIEDLKKFKHPKWAGIDLNSQFEVEAGVKEVGKVREIIKGLGDREIGG
ncbi:MAG: phosphoribosylanthranilate isomerase [Saprospiraceae bacterium]